MIVYAIIMVSSAVWVMAAIAASLPDHAVPRYTPVSHAVTCRNAYTQPYDSTSIWNTPLGDRAVFTPSGLADYDTEIFHVDTNYIVPRNTNSIPTPVR